MKITTLLTIIISGMPLLIKGQNCEVFYYKKPNMNMDLKDVPELYRNKIIELNQSASRATVINKLTYVNGVSYFTNISIENAGNVTFYMADVYKSIKEQKIFIELVSGEALERGFDFWSWEMTRDTMTVLGHLCYKAYHQFNDGSKADAWFAPSIPVMDGPADHAGLPGLILKLDLPGAIYEAFDIRPLDKDAPPIEIPEFSGIIEEGAMREAIIERATKKNRR